MTGWRRAEIDLAYGDFGRATEKIQSVAKSLESAGDLALSIRVALDPYARLGPAWGRSDLYRDRGGNVEVPDALRAAVDSLWC